MKYLLYSIICLLSFSLNGTDYVSPKEPGEYDEHLQCIVDIEGLCETEYVEEVLELCKDCDIETPEKVYVSDFEAWYRSVGIKLAYKIVEDPLEVVCYVVAAGVGTIVIIRALRQ